jgi:hypothetical protein
VWGRTDRRVWLAGTIVALAIGAVVYFAEDEDGRDWVADEVALTAQVPRAAPPEKAIAAAEEGATMVGNESGPRWVATEERVRRHEALPCTGPRDPINFEVFSAGPAVAGVPVTAAVRRCDSGALADEMPSNYFAYVYGKCQAQSKTGESCLPPLQIRSYPACQRTYADYSFEGKPLPYRELPPVGGAKVFEIEFLVDHRIEVYTGMSTIVISAADWSLAEEALELLRGQPSGKPPVTAASSLPHGTQGRLRPPDKEAIEGDLSCHV